MCIALCILQVPTKEQHCGDWFHITEETSAIHHPENSLKFSMVELCVVCLPRNVNLKRYLCCSLRLLSNIVHCV